MTTAELERLRVIMEATADATGETFFRNLVQQLATVTGTRHAFVSEFVPPQTVKTLAFWSDGRFVGNVSYQLPGTPCQEVIDGSLCYYPSGLQLKYPETEKGIEAYIGVPMKARDGRVLGHMCVYDPSPLPDEPERVELFRIFAARAAAELDRMYVYRDLADLFDEAPIAYVHEGLDTRFIRANRTALRTLGVKPEEVPRMVGKSLVPDTPEAQRRLLQAFESIGRGTDASGVVLELRRKDTGAPLWIEWWSRPDRTGTFTRTMFIDITERVRLEHERAKLKAQNTYLQEELKSLHNFDEIVGSSGALTRVLERVQRVAPTDASVMITGESGTGKELIARAIHNASKRSDKPFIKVNCAALPTSLVESELFGHERGAFSGAIQRRVGRFELAHGGTIFLDEIGEVPMDVQVKLLRVLQEREFERIGGNQTIKTDVRVIAATNRDLLQSIRDGEFRSDLYYRLNVFPVELPPLRERAEDIVLLAHFFVQKHGPRIGRRVEAIDAESLRRLVEYPWPGNIRELENIVERALILNSGPTLQIDHDALPIHQIHRLNPPVGAPPVPRPDGTANPPEPQEAHGDDDLNSVQREHILAKLRETNWVIEGHRGAAQLLGMKPGTLRHRMKRLGIERRTAG
jgi:PAS domain S-box-containing protein